LVALNHKLTLKGFVLLKASFFKTVTPSSTLSNVKEPVPTFPTASWAFVLGSPVASTNVPLCPLALSITAVLAALSFKCHWATIAEVRLY
jgi:hypothetical protein